MGLPLFFLHPPMPKHILLVDGNSIAHANHNGTTLTVGGVQVQAIFGCLRSAAKMAQMNPGSEQIWLWDGRAQFRLDIYPEYKGNRKAMDAKQAAHKEAFKKQTPFVEKMLEYLGVKQYRSPLLEADDLYYHFAKTLAARGFQVTAVSGDKDWLQGVDADVSWFDPIRDRRCTPENFLELTGYETTRAFVEGKALQGDGSDNITGVGGLGEKGAALFLAKWKSVEHFFAAVDAGTHAPAKRASKTATSLHPEQALASPEGRALFRRNMALMDLSAARKPVNGEVIQKNGTPDPEKFVMLCERFAFASILREQAMFLKTFNLTHDAAARGAA